MAKTAPYQQVCQSHKLSFTAMDVLLRPKIALGRLDRRVPEQELNLLQVPAGLAAQFRTRTPQVMGAEPLDPDFAGRRGDDRPNSPVTQAIPHLAPFAEGPEQRTFPDLGF